MPPGDGVELSGAGGSGPSRGAVPFGSPAAGYGERDPGVSRLPGASLSQGDGRLVVRVRAALETRPDLRPMIEPLLSMVAVLKLEVERLDKTIAARVEADPACRLLMTVPGVGPVTALAFAATIDDPHRFAKSRTVGAYVGLTSRRYQSGEM